MTALELMMRRLPLLPLAILLACPMATRAGDKELTAASGEQLYAQLCASCHGDAGTGNGPVAAALKSKPADLTALSARNGGTFPAERVRDTIDGRAVLPAHGEREMPVWGYELEARTPAEAPGRATAQAMTARLLAHLESIQR